MRDFIYLLQAIEAENEEMELDLSSLGTINTMFAALFRHVNLHMLLYFIS